jgi:hypothetical protein
MNPQMEIGTDEKALHINLDSAKYGTFAEIGAGQEVARRFFRIGGAAGTIAKTMSAYDMTFSDAIYGPADRYVSRVRLQTMLDHEYDLLIERLDRKFGAEKTFFVFADTIAARSFKERNESHGWLGVRFQSQPRGATKPDHYPCSVARRSKRRPTRSSGVHRGESSPRLLLLSATGKTDFVTSGKSSTGTNRSGHDQIFRASVWER